MTTQITQEGKACQPISPKKNLICICHSKISEGPLFQDSDEVQNIHKRVYPVSANVNKLAMLQQEQWETNSTQDDFGNIEVHT